MGICFSTPSVEPPVQQFQRREPEYVVSYPPVVKPSAPPMQPPMQTVQQSTYVQPYTYAQMPQQQTQWAQVPYQYQVYPPQQQRYYVAQPQSQQPSSGIGGFAAGVVTGAVINSMLDYDDPY